MENEGKSMPNMTERPGYWTMEMNGGSSAPYLACTPCVPFFVHCLLRVEAEGLLDYQGRAGIILKESASQCSRVCQNYPLANYP